MRAANFILVAWALSALPAAAEGPEACRAIKDDKARLTCFDTAAWPSPAPVKAAEPAPSSAQSRMEYAAQIERSFLKDGQDMSVMSLEGPDKTGAFSRDKKAYPMLILFAYFGKPFVYKVISETPFLDTAQKLGYRNVDFFSRNDGHWYFEIPASGPVPQCDRNRGLCR